MADIMKNPDIFDRALITGADGMIGSYIDFGIRTNHRQLDVTNLAEVMKVCNEHKPNSLSTSLPRPMWTTANVTRLTLTIWQLRRERWEQSLYTSLLRVCLMGLKRNRMLKKTFPHRKRSMGIQNISESS